jgi:hypothetical protein
MKHIIFLLLAASLLSGCVQEPANRRTTKYYMGLVDGPDKHQYILLNVNGHPQLLHAAGCNKEHQSK